MPASSNLVEWTSEGHRYVKYPYCASPINHGSNKKTFTQLERHLNKKCKEYANCPGLTFDWKLGSPFSTYPFGIHAEHSTSNPGYNFVTANERVSTVTTRSLSCMISLLGQELFCSSHVPRFQIPRSFTVATRTSSTVTSDSLFS
ncbi:hypothetical protein GYMLUDRAFT_45279 [Collybiopsis luxurians FD-317 M1]|uniref:Uncharacterized protein n=1 Tax=Collybiopsis luxurians FD-317 M1 TaxID=944289 RepID=A0A0D0BSN1_9AGAR|nr:hypothetical protein GYMLUDRAFT_45279 [Collybiopsis luxurians FD-317 M1]